MPAPARRPGVPSSGGTVLGALAAVLALVLAASSVEPGLAAWGAAAQRTSAPVSVAVVGSSFVPRSGGGTGGATFYTGSLLGLGGTALTVDLVSISTVPVVLTGTLTTNNLLLGTRVALASCTVPWQGAVCPGTARTVLVDQAVQATLPVQWTAPGTPLAALGTLYLRVTVAGSLANTVVVTATPAPARAPGDRTAA